jgi:hypothetical protein
MLVLVWNVPSAAQPMPERSQVFRPQGQGGVRSEMVAGRQAAAGEVLFKFRDEYMAPAFQQQLVVTLDELMKTHDTE